MNKLFVSAFLLSAIVLFSSATSAQSSDDAYVLHVQTWKFKSLPTGDDAEAFNEMLKKQSGVLNSDSRVLSSRVLRHNWGNDSRDLVMIAEFKNRAELFSFYDEFGSMMEKAFSKEEMDKDNALWDKYVGQHSDEIYQEVAGTRK